MLLTKLEMEVASGAGNVPFYLAMPEKHNGLALLVLQEIFGVNANIRHIVDAYASLGFIVCAPDLYWRQQKGLRLDPSNDDDRQLAMHLMKDLDHDECVSDCQSVIDWIKIQNQCINKFAALGYCFGGSVAFLLACRNIVPAGLSYYGTGIHKILDEMPGLQGKLLMHIAEEDHLCPAPARNAICRAAKLLSNRVTVEIYPRVGHAFAREGDKAFDREAARKANERTHEFLLSLIC